MINSIKELMITHNFRIGKEFRTHHLVDPFE